MNRFHMIHCRINLNSENGLKHWYPPPSQKDKCDSYFGSFINEKKRAILVPRWFFTVPTGPGFHGETRDSLGPKARCDFDRHFGLCRLSPSELDCVDL